jgi:hypothetical protein
VHELRRGKLYPVARAGHAEVPSRNRVWLPGEGHVGQSVEHEQMMVSGDIRATRAWIHHPSTEDTDRLNYVSVMARPYLRPDGRPGGAVTLTSSRVHHFTNLDQPAAVAFDMTVRLIGLKIRVSVVRFRPWPSSSRPPCFDPVRLTALELSEVLDSFENSSR